MTAGRSIPAHGVCRNLGTGRYGSCRRQGPSRACRTRSHRPAGDSPFNAGICSSSAVGFAVCRGYLRACGSVLRRVSAFVRPPHRRRRFGLFLGGEQARCGLRLLAFGGFDRRWRRLPRPSPAAATCRLGLGLPGAYEPCSTISALPGALDRLRAVGIAFLTKSVHW